MKQSKLRSNLMMRLVISGIIMLFVLHFAEAQNVIPTSTPGSSFTGNSRGYWFTAPCDFRITGVRAPTDYSTTPQTIHLVKFTSPPPNYSSSTTAFTTLFYGTNITDTCYVDLDIQVPTGDVIGVMAVRDNGTGSGVTSYVSTNGPISSSIGPYTISLQRLGWQGNIISSPADNFWTEPGNPIGRAEITYELEPALIPVPAHNSFFTGNSRGFWFTAPCDFLLTGIRAPIDANTNPQSIHLVRFPSTPPNHPTTTTSFTTLFYGNNINDTGFININVQVYSGDIIGVLAVRDNGLGSGQTSYTAGTSPISSTIGNHAISLQRLGWQGNIISSPAANLWTEPGLQIGRAELRYEFPPVYHYLPGGLIANSYPFYEPPTGSNKRQWIYYPSDMNCAPSGYVNTVYLKTSGTINSDLTGLLIRMGNTTLNTFPTSTFITAIDTALYAPSIHLSSISESWIPIRLKRPFYYDGSSNFIVEVSHQGATPGFYVLQTTLPGRSIYGNSGLATGTQQDRLAALGLGLVTDYTDAKLQVFFGPGPSLCEGQHPVSVEMKNLSPHPLTQAQIHLQINGATQPVYHWTGNLQPGSTTIVNLGVYPFAANMSPYNLKAWVSQPNNTLDYNPYNDTIFYPNVTVVPPAIVNLGPDVTLKAGGSIVLNAGAGFATYLWSTGASTSTITVDSSGTGIGVKTVWVQVLNAQGCSGSDTVLVTFIDDTGIEDLTESRGIIIRPNPNDGRFELILDGFTSGEYNIQIFGPEGSMVREMILQLDGHKQLLPINLSDLPGGLYMLKLIGSQGIVTRKFVIMR